MNLAEASIFSWCVEAFSGKPKLSLAQELELPGNRIEDSIKLRPSRGFETTSSGLVPSISDKSATLDTASYEIHHFPKQGKDGKNLIAIVFQTRQVQSNPDFDLRQALYQHSIFWSVSAKSLKKLNITEEKVQNIFEEIYKGDPLGKAYEVYNKVSVLPRNYDGSVTYFTREQLEPYLNVEKQILIKHLSE